MPSLRELQAAVAGALLGGDAEPAAASIEGDGLPPASRLEIYRHHVVTTLTAALEAAFPVVCGLVDRRFFAYAADAYIREHPPAGPCLFEYGDTFAEFLAGFPPCRHLPYLPDVARLERAMEIARHAETRDPIDAARFSILGVDDLPRLTVRLDPSLTLVASAWPIDRIWHAHQGDGVDVAPVDLSAGGVYLEIRRRGEAVTIRSITESCHAFRHALRAGRTLDQAAAAALSADGRFDVTAAIHDLIHEAVWVE